MSEDSCSKCNDTGTDPNGIFFNDCWSCDAAAAKNQEISNLKDAADLASAQYQNNPTNFSLGESNRAYNEYRDALNR